MSRRDRDDDSDDREDEKPFRNGFREGRRRKGGMPGWAWALIAAGGVLVLACGGFGIAVVMLKSAEKNAHDQAMANATVIQFGQEHRIGDIGIKVTGCNDGAVRCDSAFGEQYDIGDFTVIYLTVENHNPTRNADVGGQTDKAVVIDDLGNRLAREIPYSKTHGTGTVRNQIQVGFVRSVRSGEPEQDTVIVARTVPAVKRVKVYIDAKQYGGTGYLVADVPIAERQGKAK